MQSIARVQGEYPFLGRGNHRVHLLPCTVEAGDISVFVIYAPKVFKIVLEQVFVGELLGKVSIGVFVMLDCQPAAQTVVFVFIPEHGPGLAEQFGDGGDGLAAVFQPVLGSVSETFNDFHPGRLRQVVFVFRTGLLLIVSAFVVCAIVYPGNLGCKAVSLGLQ